MELVTPTPDNAVSPTFAFPQAVRLKSPAEFQAVYDRKRSVSDALLVIYAKENADGRTRVGLSVSKKIGNAVARNRCKRLFREAFRLSRPDLPAGVDFIMIPRNVSREPTVPELRESLVKLVRDAARKLNPRPA